MELSMLGDNEMPSIAELERTIQDEKTEEIWASIDKDFLKDCEKHREWHNDFTKKEYHPMSYQVKKEVDEWEQSAPLFKEYEKLQTTWLYICVGYMSVSLGIGILLVGYIFS